MNNKNKKIIIISIFTIIGIALIYLSYIGINKMLNSNKETNNDRVENNIPKDEIVNPWIDDEPIESKYTFGNKVSISKLKEVKDYYGPGETGDFSKWFVLEDDGTYITLISAEIFGKIDSQDDGIKTSFFKKYNIKFGNEGYSRLLNKEDLELYFECNFDSLKCTKNIASIRDVVSPYLSILTSEKIQNKVVVYDLKNNSLVVEKTGTTIYPYLITMKILKENL